MLLLCNIDGFNINYIFQFIQKLKEGNVSEEDAQVIFDLFMDKETREEFWEKHKISRIELDKNRDIKKDAEKLRLDMKFLKTGRLI